MQRIYICNQFDQIKISNVSYEIYKIFVRMEFQTTSSLFMIEYILVGGKEVIIMF
jgi:hypothetical protein